MGRVSHKAGGLADAALEEDALNGGWRDPANFSNCVDYPLLGFVVRDVAVPEPDSDAAGEDTFSGSPVEHDEYEK